MLLLLLLLLLQQQQNHFYCRWKWPFWKLQCMPWLTEPCNIQIKVKLKLVKAVERCRIDTKHKCLNCTDWEWEAKTAWHALFFSTVRKKKSPATLVCTWAHAHRTSHIDMYYVNLSQWTVFVVAVAVAVAVVVIRIQCGLHLCLRLIMLCIHVRNRTECEITSLRSD